MPPLPPPGGGRHPAGRRQRRRRWRHGSGVTIGAGSCRSAPCALHMRTSLFIWRPAPSHCFPSTTPQDSFSPTNGGPARRRVLCAGCVFAVTTSSVPCAQHGFDGQGPAAGRSHGRRRRRCVRPPATHAAPVYTTITAPPALFQLLRWSHLHSPCLPPPRPEKKFTLAARGEGAGPPAGPPARSGRRRLRWML